jgi:hypothetical protein
MFPYISDIRDLLYLRDHLEFEKEQMEIAEVSKDFFEYQSISNWLLELNIRIANWEFQRKMNTYFPS